MSDQENKANVSLPGASADEVVQIVASALILSKMMEKTANAFAGPKIGPDHVVAASILLLSWIRSAIEAGSIVTPDEDVVLAHHLDIAKRLLNVIGKSEMKGAVDAAVSQAVDKRVQTVPIAVATVPADHTKN